MLGYRYEAELRLKGLKDWWGPRVWLHQDDFKPNVYFKFYDANINYTQCKYG